MTAIINTDGQPPPPSPYIPIVSPRSGNPPVEGVILSTAVYGCYTHFVQMRTVPCHSLTMTAGGTETTQSCVACAQGYARRWKGYVAVLLARGGRIALLELTHSGVYGCPRLWPDQPPLRGLRIRVVRTGRKANARVQVTVQDCLPANTADLPHCPDVEEALMRVWFGGPAT